MLSSLSASLTAFVEPVAGLLTDVDPVLVGIIAILLLIAFGFFLLVRRTLLSFSEGMRKGRNK